MFNKTDISTQKESEEIHFLSTLARGLNSFYQGLSVFFLLFISISVFNLSLILALVLVLPQNAQAEASKITIITNTATASFSINGIAQSKSDSVQFTKNSPVKVLQPLLLTKQSNKKSVRVGDTLHFTLTINNKNNEEIKNITIKDKLPKGLEYQPNSAVLVTDPHHEIEIDTKISAGNLVFPLGNIPAKSQWILSYNTVVTNKASSTPLINKAQIITATNAANSALSQASVELISDNNNQTNNILISKQADRQTANADDLITYTINIQNPSQKTSLTHLVIYDTLPTGLIYKTGSVKVNGKSLPSSKILFNARSLQISLGTLNKKQSLAITYQVSVSRKAIGTTAINIVEASSDHAVSDQAKATVKIRTPSVIDFLKIDGAGINTVIPTTSFNTNRSNRSERDNNKDNWGNIDHLVLANGSNIALPSSQPIIKADEYSIFEPIIIRVTDHDQNLDDAKKEHVLITINIPETGDKEILKLTETSTNSGVFIGAIQASADNSKQKNGRISLREGVKINLNYRDNEDNTDISTTAALVVASSKFTLTKIADKQTATIGELVHYTLSFENPAKSSLANIKVIDTLPAGFQYVAGSAQLNSVRLQSGVEFAGRSLVFNLKDMPKSSQWTLEYATRISVGVKYGNATNVAHIVAGSHQSNTARVIVKVNDDLMKSHNILTGRVYIGCQTESPRNTLENSRIYLETGRSVISDGHGFWHIEGVQPGSHVLQLDTESLPDGYEPILCEDNSRHAGDAKSKFVDLQAGSLWRVDFHVKNTKAGISHPNNNKATSDKEINPVKLYGDDYLKNANADFEILWPKNNYVPAIASTKIIVKSPVKYKVEVFLNDAPVSALNYDGSDTNKARTTTIRRWVGVDIDIKHRDNTLLVILKDPSGKEVARKTHNIHFSGKPASAELLTEESVLVADGKTTPVIALLIKDEDGFPMRANTHGYYKLENSSYHPKTLTEDKDRLDLNESFAGSYKYLIGEGGIARIEFNPTAQSGELKLTPQFARQNHKNGNKQLNLKRDKTISVWLKPHLREWIMVGIAEGTLGYQTISGNMKANDLNNTDKFYKRGRIAFFAKGRVRGKYLLTLAYDSHKQKQEVGSQLGGTINPDAWYTIYADNSSNQYDAPSSKKLYVKLEKANFYALFGDYYTGLTITELARYERVLNGFKTEYKDDRYSVKGFISETSNQHQHQEIPGDGTSGLYYLNGRTIPNSETIRLETRDRFHSDRILQTRNLVRYQDYEIDYDSGTLYFKFPISGRDKDFNPNIIVVDYDNEDKNSNKAITAGGRVSVKTFGDKVEVGLSILNKGRNQVKDDRLIATDILIK
jgi:uncharacterized repeat protein (TIGR01451 family)